MSKRRYFGPAALAMTTVLVIVACSSETPTSPTTASDTPTRPPEASLSLTAAPTIAAWWRHWAYSSWYVSWGTLCYPARLPYYNRDPGCPSSNSLYISNTGGGTLNWTSTKSATWIKRSPRYGTAPSTMKVWVDGTGLPIGTYYGWIKIWATGATNSPQKVFVTMIRRNAS